MYLNLRSFEIALVKSGINPMELAKKADLNYASIRRARKGYPLKPKTIWKISQALGVSAENLLEDRKEE